MSFQPGDVIRVYDRQVRPPKPKWLICIAPERQLFLRINSRPIHKPHHPLPASDNDFLEHDSYVELRQLVRPYAYEIGIAEHLGRLSQAQAAALIEATQNCKTLSQDHKDLIAQHLSP